MSNHTDIIKILLADSWYREFKNTLYALCVNWVRNQIRSPMMNTESLSEEMMYLNLLVQLLSQRGSHWIWSPWQLNTNTSPFLRHQTSCNNSHTKFSENKWDQLLSSGLPWAYLRSASLLQNDKPSSILHRWHCELKSVLKQQKYHSA